MAVDRAEFLLPRSTAPRGHLAVVFRSLAQRRGISPTTVRRKYYEVKRASKVPRNTLGTRWTDEQERLLVGEAGAASGP
jgi:hypothetical protein